MFQPAGEFLFLTTEKYKLTKQALGSLVCEKARKLIQTHYQPFKDAWKPLKFSHGTLTIGVNSSLASSELFLRSHDFITRLNLEDIPLKVEQIKIQRQHF